MALPLRSHWYRYVRPLVFQAPAVARSVAPILAAPDTCGARIAATVSTSARVTVACRTSSGLPATSVEA